MVVDGLYLDRKDRRQSAALEHIVYIKNRKAGLSGALWRKESNL